MEIAIVGLGKMGLGIYNRLTNKGIKSYGFDSGWNEEAYKKNDNIQPRYGFYTAECLDSLEKKIGTKQQNGIKLQQTKKDNGLKKDTGVVINQVIYIKNQEKRKKLGTGIIGLINMIQVDGNVFLN